MKEVSYSFSAMKGLYQWIAKASPAPIKSYIGTYRFHKNDFATMSEEDACKLIFQQIVPLNLELNKAIAEGRAIVDASMSIIQESHSSSWFVFKYIIEVN